MRVSHRARSVLHHLHNALQKAGWRELDDGDFRLVADLVWRRADAISQECVTMLSKPVWQDIIDAYPTLQLDSTVVTVVLNVSAELDLRILTRMRRWPELLLMFAKSLPDVRCPLRKAVANRIANMEEEDMEINTLKFWLLFRDDVLQASTYGTVEDYCYNFVLSLAKAYHADTQTVEGLNSLLKNELRKAPHISLPLLSGRLGTKHLLGAAGRSKKWSDVEPVFEALLAMSMAHLVEAERVLEEDQRWGLNTPEPPHRDPYTVLRLPVPLPKSSEKRVAWANNMNLHWYRASTQSKHVAALVQTCLAFSSPLKLRYHVWIPCTKLGMPVHLARATVIPGKKISIDKPFCFEPSTKVFEQYYQAAVTNGPLDVHEYNITWTLTAVTAIGKLDGDPRMCLQLTEQHHKPWKPEEDAAEAPADAAAADEDPEAAEAELARALQAALDATHFSDDDEVDGSGDTICDVPGTAADALTREELKRLEALAIQNPDSLDGLGLGADQSVQEVLIAAAGVADESLEQPVGPDEKYKDIMTEWRKAYDYNVDIMMDRAATSHLPLGGRSTPPCPNRFFVPHLLSVAPLPTTK